MRTVTVKTPDGVNVAVQEWGNREGPNILFIHGFSQSHLSWTKQVLSDLAKTFHMVTYDIRGHGQSDKPLDAVFYTESHRWADACWLAGPTARGRHHDTFLFYLPCGTVRTVRNPLQEQRKVTFQSVRRESLTDGFKNWTGQPHFNPGSAVR